jgi:pseudaminic acid cytidylyltransferase
MSKSVAIITARGGSKRIPRKNIKNFMDKPIIAYSILAALESGVFDEVMVSTDDQEIAEVSKQYGAVVPFFRSKETSDDFSNTSDVLKEVITVYESLGKKFDYVCCIYPTAPFVTAAKLQAAFRLLKESDADGVMPVAEFSFPIWRSVKMDEGHKITFNWPENAFRRSQDLPPAYHDCGQYYFLNTERFMATGKLVSDHTLGVLTPPTEMQDIDNEEDWKLAEIKYSFQLKKK